MVYYAVAQCTFILENCYKVEVVSKNGDEVVVRGGDDRRNIRGTGSLRLSIKEVVTHRAIDHTPPVFLHEYLTVHTHTHMEISVPWALNRCSTGIKMDKFKVYSQ